MPLFYWKPSSGFPSYSEEKPKIHKMTQTALHNGGPLLSACHHRINLISYPLPTPSALPCWSSLWISEAPGKLLAQGLSVCFFPYLEHSFPSWLPPSPPLEQESKKRIKYYLLRKASFRHNHCHRHPISSLLNLFLLGIYYHLTCHIFYLSVYFLLLPECKLTRIGILKN